MDGAKIQRKIWRGYEQAAIRLGSQCAIYRPTGDIWTDPITKLPLHRIAEQFVSLNAEDMKYSKPSKYGKPTWYALLDGTGLKPGDYFVSPEGTFFIAALQALLPILVVECNRTATFYRVAQQFDVGAGTYSGITAQNAIPYLTGAPCSILQGTKGEKSVADLPGDTRLPWWSILVPAQAGNILYGDLITDDRGIRYIISSSELTDLGYRLTATQATT